MMNWRTTIIIVGTAIPVIVVAFILLDHYLKEDPVYEQCEEDGACVRLCCEEDAICDENYNMTAHGEIAWNLTEGYRIIKNKPCKETFELEHNGFKFLENGHIWVNESGTESNNTWDEYCLHIQNGTITVQICGLDDSIEKLRETYPYFMIVSMPFLIITLIVYGFIKDLRNLHGKCLIAYVSSLTVMYGSLIIIRMHDEKLVENSRFACSSIGYTFLTSIWCCFLWLNIMCYDIYRTFRQGMKAEDNVQFLKYCGYGFGIPVLISIINFTLNNFELIAIEYNNGIGTTTCTVLSDNTTVQWIYIYGPITLLLAINVSFYGTTAWKIFRVQNETSKVCRSENSQRHSKCNDSNDNSTRFLLYLRLSIVMGVPWIVELCSFMLGDSVIFFIVSIFNCMQGFVVFITFVWNPKVTKQLTRRYTAMSVSFKKSQSQSITKKEPARGDSFATAVTKINGVTSDSSAQV